MPGIGQHLFESLRFLIKNWRIFLPFLALMVIASIVFVGIVNQENYIKFQEALDQVDADGGGKLNGFTKAGLLLVSAVTTSGLTGQAGEGAIIFQALIFLVIWLVTIYIMRHYLAGQKVKLRDGLYNAMSPLISTFVVLIVVLLETLPILIMLVAYSAAVQTDFLAAPFYALLFLVFAALMILISAYLLSGSLIALIAVSAPGLYPMEALKSAADLVAGRRMKIIIRVLALIIAIILAWVVVMLPLILLDMGAKNLEWTRNIPFIPICLVIMTCFTEFYITVYLYLYYKWMLGYEKK